MTDHRNLTWGWRFLLTISSIFLLTPILEAQEVPFSRGVNLTRWFQADSPRSIHFTRYDKQDLENIKSLGCDVIRLPIHLHEMVGDAPEYALDPLFTRFLDQVIDWAEELQIYLILDNHTFSVEDNTSPTIEPTLTKVWQNMAMRYRDRSHYVMYEVLNEPHGIDDAVWNRIQKNVVAAIREVDDKHTIVVGGAGWNSYNNLALIPDLGDDNLIYTFHFYDPFLFTHQGATWVRPSMQPLADVPFPYDAGRMPPLDATLANSWVAFNYAAYPLEGNAARIKELIDIAVAFREERGLPVFCGEFGVYQPNSQESDRVAWYRVVRTYLEEKGIPWTIWDYHQGFGIFAEGGNGLFDHDLNLPLLQSLGLALPEQTPYVQRPDSVGFPIYTDVIESGMVENGFGGQKDFYAENDPNYGDHCLRWDDVGQYNAISFDFGPDKDLSQLTADGYALDLFFRTDVADLSFDVRFVDTNEEGEDLPWRIRWPVHPAVGGWSEDWQHLHIPLSSFTEHGAWDNAWYNPIGAFDWTAIDRFEVSTEYSGFSGYLELDQVMVTNLDTAQVRMVTSTSFPIQATVKCYPNPVRDHLTIAHTGSGPLVLELFDQVGRRMAAVEGLGTLSLDVQHWPSGIYMGHFAHASGRGHLKIVKR